GRLAEKAFRKRSLHHPVHARAGRQKGGVAQKRCRKRRRPNVDSVRPSPPRSRRPPHRRYFESRSSILKASADQERRSSDSTSFERNGRTVRYTSIWSFSIGM